jgi:hypothetical protein
VEEVTKALEAFRFESLTPIEQGLFRNMKTHGAAWVARHLQAAMEFVIKKDPENLWGRFGNLAWALGLGSAVLNLVPKAVRSELLPFNDVRFHYLGDNTDIVVECRSLLQLQRDGRTFYYSRLMPTAELEGKSYKIAFSEHAIDRIKDRIVPDWDQYAGLGDVYAYLEQCVYFEPCRLLNLDRGGRNQQLALTFYDLCGNKQMGQYQYVIEVLGEENLNPALGSPYYRVGYCPAFPDPNDEFINLRTLLFPGFKQTPEYGALMASSLSQDDKDRLAAVATDGGAAISLRDKGDFSALRWFHEHGVPQVIQTKTRVYQTFPKRKFRVTKIIKK